MQTFKRQKALEDMKNNLSEKRYLHSLAVAETARELADIYGVDLEKAYTAGLFHDFAKYMKQNQALSYLEDLEIDDSILLENANLAHGMIAAYILEKDYDLKDKEILSAIDKHTFGDVNMSTLDKIIFIADAIEPNRQYKAVGRLRELAKTDLDLACFEYLKNNFIYLLSENRKIHKQSVEMYNAFKNFLAISRL